MSKETEFILIRHGEVDYNKIKDKGFIGHGNDLEPLTNNGIIQTKSVAKSDIFNNCNILITSPYTRTMQTASIISNEINLPLNVEVDLHEWIPDFTYQYDNKNIVHENYKKAIYEYENNINNHINKEYESIRDVRIRVLNTLKNYLKYDKVCVVTHGGVMYSITGKRYNYNETEKIILGKEKIKYLKR